MPGYFSIVIQIKKDNKYNDLISDLTDALISNGFIYDRPDYDCEDNSLSDVIFSKITSIDRNGLLLERDKC